MRVVAASAAHQRARPQGDRSAQQLQGLPYCYMRRSASSRMRPVDAQLPNDCMRRLVFRGIGGAAPHAPLTGSQPGCAAPARAPWRWCAGRPSPGRGYRSAPRPCPPRHARCRPPPASCQATARAERRPAHALQAGMPLTVADNLHHLKTARAILARARIRRDCLDWMSQAWEDPSAAWLSMYELCACTVVRECPTHLLLLLETA